MFAHSLNLLTDTVFGRLPEAQTRARAREVFESLTRDATCRNALARDAASTYLLTLAITDLLNFGSVRLESYRNELSRLKSAAAHTRWLRLLESASRALAGGDTTQAAVDWRQLPVFIPRFAPPRLVHAIKLLLQLIDFETPSPLASSVRQGHVGMVIAHWKGDLATAARQDPSATVQPKSQSPMLRAIHEDIMGSQSENPVQLMRAGEMLAELSYWAPAARAFSHARQILIRRRSSGAIVACSKRLSEILEAAQASVSWVLEPCMPSNVEASPRLTPREIEVAQLAAQGTSNRSIATALSLSVRTIESHLAQARAKLGATSRSELAARLQDIA